MTLLTTDDLNAQQREFATFCYDNYSFNELQAALQGEPPRQDLKNWDITAIQWHQVIRSVLNEVLTEDR